MAFNGQGYRLDYNEALNDKATSVCGVQGDPATMLSTWGVSTRWTGIWNGMMEWNDGMENGMKR